MSDRACGGPERAWHRLGRLARVLHDTCAMPLLFAPDGTALVHLASIPPGHCEHVWLARLVWREQQELSAVARRVNRAPDDARTILVLAGVEYLTWVEFDPWRGTFPELPLSVGVEEWTARMRSTFLDTATGLRHLDDPRLGDVSKSVWDDARRYPGLRDLALLELGAHESVPTPTPPPLHRGVPVRDGLRLAWLCGRVRAGKD